MIFTRKFAKMLAFCLMSVTVFFTGLLIGLTFNAKLSKMYVNKTALIGCETIAFTIEEQLEECLYREKVLKYEYEQILNHK